MKVKEFLSQFRFDELIPHIIAHDADAADQIAHYREAFDILMHTEPEQNDEVLRVIYNREWEEIEPPYVCVEFCDAGAWAFHLGEELFVEEGISEMEAAANIMWEITYYGFSPEVIEEYFERITDNYIRPRDKTPANKYEAALKKLEQKMHDNYEPKWYDRKCVEYERNEFGRSVRAIHYDPDLWDKSMKWSKQHMAHRNRPKRMRDSRQKRRIEQLKHLSRIETIIKRMRERVPGIPGGELEWLRLSDYIETGRYDSRAYDLSRRLEYLWESLTVYDKIEPLPDSKTVILVRTSPEHPLTDAERTTLDRIAALYGDPSQVTVYVGTAPSLGTEADLYIVRTQKR